MSVKISKIPLRKKTCNDQGIGQDLMEFAKIFMPKSLKKIMYFYFYFKKKNAWVFFEFRQNLILMDK